MRLPPVAAAAALAALAAAPAARADFASQFDCAARTMALEFSFALQPDRPAALFTALAEALNSTSEKPANCSVSATRGLLDATRDNPRLRTVDAAYLAARARGGLSVYVDPLNGNDGNDGSVGAPLKTIPAALGKTRAAPGGRNTIVLRGGTHYPGATQVLTPADSGLDVVGFPGEQAWVSGAVPLGPEVTWSPYNVSTTSDWQLFPNTTVVSSCCTHPGESGPGVPFLGLLDNATACLAACNATAGCTAYTWHDTNQGDWSRCCYGRTDGKWNPQASSGHFSGLLPPPTNVWVASLAPVAGSIPPYGVLGMRFRGDRLQRARYPNWNSEVSFGPNFKAGWTPQTAPRAPDVQIDIPLIRNASTQLFHNFTAGIGGTCTGRFDPPAGYWCSANVEGGGSQIFFVPVAMNVTRAELPHTPYANPRGGIIMTWRPGHWASWMAEIGDWTYDPATGASNFSVARGLFQGSRGADEGDEVYIENVFEELDAPGEWFYNASTSLLYLWNNESAATPGGTPPPPPSDGSVALVALKHLFNVTGTQAAPVVDVSFLGVGFVDTALTYMDPHGLPSGGDWSLERSAVLFAEGTEGLRVSGCVFENLDGNALLLSAYTRNASVTHNEFSLLGASAVALWGNTYGGDPRLPPGYGVDGSGGDQPRGVEVAYNWASRLGIWQKQSSFFTQFKSGMNHVHSNVVYQGPRAHLNHNDGFLGGTLVEKNMLAIACQESSDHAPFNSWDRDAMTFDLPNGTITSLRMYDVIRYNFVIADGFSLGFVDNDDGSNRYIISSNVQTYGSGVLKNDWDGFDGHANDNLAVFVNYAATNGYGNVIGAPGSQRPEYRDSFINNTVYQVMEQSYGYAHAICNSSSATVLGNNTIYTPSGVITDCGVPLAQWQAMGNDLGTVSLPLSAADPVAFIDLARRILSGGVPPMAKAHPAFVEAYTDILGTA